MVQWKSPNVVIFYRQCEENLTYSIQFMVDINLRWKNSEAHMIKQDALGSFELLTLAKDGFGNERRGPEIRQYHRICHRIHMLNSDNEKENL